jgi:hypothetical protein
MANEYDKKLMPGFVQSAFVVSLGAAYKGFEMMIRPQDSVPKMFSEVSALFKLPEDTGSDLKSKAEAIAGNFMEKGTSIVQECQKAGGKFVDSD